MSRRLAWLAVALVFCLGCGRQERNWRGQPLSYWEKQAADAEPAARSLAAAAFGSRAWKARIVLPKLQALLADVDPAVREAAARALGERKLEAKGAVPDLIKLLESPLDATRAFASQALGAIGPDAKDALPSLAKVAKAGGYASGGVAAKAMGQIRGGSSEKPGLQEKARAKETKGSKKAGVQETQK